MVSHLVIPKNWAKFGGLYLFEVSYTLAFISKVANYNSDVGLSIMFNNIKREFSYLKLVYWDQYWDEMKLTFCFLSRKFLSSFRESYQDIKILYREEKSIYNSIFINSLSRLGESETKARITSSLLTPRFPMRQIGAFRTLRRDCARLRHRRMSWIVSKGRAAVFLS